MIAKSNKEKCLQIARLATSVFSRKYKMIDTGYNLWQRAEYLGDYTEPTQSEVEEVQGEFRRWMKWARNRKSNGLDTEQRIF